jgi:hypothetical protein
MSIRVHGCMRAQSGRDHLKWSAARPVLSVSWDEFILEGERQRIADVVDSQKQLEKPHGMVPGQPLTGSDKLCKRILFSPRECTGERHDRTSNP